MLLDKNRYFPLHKIRLLTVYRSLMSNIGTTKEYLGRIYG